jgi:hypothetical protein
MTEQRIELGECITGKSRNRQGYARVRHEGKSVLAHRLAYCLHHEIPLSAIADQVIRHKCDNPPCINPLHLESGTHADNTRDKIERGRQARWHGKRRGEANPKCKLTKSDVDAILTRYAPYCKKNGLTAIAREYGMSRNTMKDVVYRRTWK